MNKIIEETKAISCRCPKCEKLNTVNFSIFDVKNNNKYQTKCSCGKSNIKISRISNNYEIEIPCIFCEENHIFDVSKSIMLRGELFSFECPNFEFGYGVFGNIAKVQKWIDNDLSSVDMLKKQLDEITDEENAEYELFADSLYHYNELEKTSKAKCECGCESLFLHVIDDFFCIECSSCKATLEVGPDKEDFEDFLEEEELVIPSYRARANKLNIKLIKGCK